MKILMLNQKTGINYDDVNEYISETKIYQKNFVIFPTSIFLPIFVESGYNVGIQNIAESSKKNQTGEVTAKQASDSGARYVIIGHSERRTNQNETDEVLVNKFNEAIDNKLNIVFCIGESLVDYKLKNTINKISEQLYNVLSKIKKMDKRIELYVAYEPLWAIGTGMTPTNIEIEKVAKTIKDFLNETGFDSAKVLYGGSVSDDNIKELSTIDIVDGFLVGGASNVPTKVIQMCEYLNNSTN